MDRWCDARIESRLRFSADADGQHVTVVSLLQSRHVALEFDVSSRLFWGTQVKTRAETEPKYVVRLYCNILEIFV